MSSIVGSVRLKIYATRVRSSENDVLQYNRAEDRLIIWGWPSTRHGRVAPSELPNHRTSHRMLGPCCLCPLANPEGPDFVESAVYVVALGQFAGEYVASCAKGDCSYFVFMERLYDRNGVTIRSYPRQAFGERIPLRVTHASEQPIMPRAVGPSRTLKRSYAMLDIDEGAIPTSNAPAVRTHRSKTVPELVHKLDARIQPGITVTEFLKLFCQCECGLVTTRRVFSEHTCILDLTHED